MPGLNTTFDVLAKTPNEAAVNAIIRALDSQDRSVRDAALRAATHRSRLNLQEAVLQRWHLLADRGRDVIVQGNEWLSPAIRVAIRGYEGQFNANGCDAAIALRDYEMLPALIEAMNDTKHPFRERAAATLVSLSEMLHDVLHAPRDYRDRRDPNQLRQYVMPSLEHCVTRGDAVSRTEIIEAFLLLAGRENAALKHILVTPSDRHHQPIEEMLTGSTRPGLVRLLLSYLDEPNAPLAVLQVIGRRTDVTFIRQLFKRIGNEPSKTVKGNLHRITRCQWLEEGLAVLEAVNENEQAGAAQFAVYTGIDRALALEVVSFLLRRGGPAARRTAAALIGEFPGPMADELILVASNDLDPYVRATVAPQLRKRRIAGGIQRLLEMVESTNDIERQAARTALEEFHFDHLLDLFEELSPEVQRRTGNLVKRVDPQALSRLSAELRSDQRQRRKRGLELVVAMEAIGELHQEITSILQDEDEYLRADAVRVLAQFDIPETRQALRAAMLDPSRLVQETAERALSELRGKSKQPLVSFDVLANDLHPSTSSWVEGITSSQEGAT